MKRSTRNIFLLLTIFLSMITSCGLDYTYQMQVVSMDVSIGLIEEFQFDVFDRLESNIIEIEQADEFAIRLDFNYQNSVGLSQFQLPWIRSVYAESEPLAQLEYYKITSIEIISDADFNSLYPAGSDLSHLFNLKEFYHFFNDSYYTFNEVNYFYYYSFLESITVNSFFNQNEIDNFESDVILMVLNEQPALEELHNFTIIYKNDNGQEFTGTISDINFL